MEIVDVFLGALRSSHPVLSTAFFSKVKNEVAIWTLKVKNQKRTPTEVLCDKIVLPTNCF